MNITHRIKLSLRWICQCLIALVTFASVSAQQPAFLTNGLVVYYPFDGDAKDQSGKNYNGQALNSSYVADRFGKPASSVSFANANDQSTDHNLIQRFQYPGDVINQASTQGTISAWLLPRTGVGSIISKAAPTHDSSPVLSYGGFTQNTGWTADGEDGVIYFHPRNSGPLLLSSKPLALNAWTHVVVAYSATEAHIYLDGIEAGSGVGNYSMVVTQTPAEYAAIGAYIWDNNGSFPNLYSNAEFDDFRIFNRVLSAVEVATLYQYESIPQKTDPRQATAAATVVNGFVVGATINDGGSGYTKAPNVVISGGGGSGAAATATIDANGSVSSITIINSGSKYTGIPSITIDAPPFPPSQAKGTATLINGFVTGVTITDNGHGYEGVIPPVTFLGGGGSGAKGIAIVSNGVVTGISMTASVSGYTKPPYALIAAPPGLARAEISVHSVDVTLHLVPGYTYKVQTAIDARSTWVDVETGILAVDATVVRTFDVTTNTQLFRVIQVN